MAFFKVIFLLHYVGLVELSSYGDTNSFSTCSHRNISAAYEHLLKQHICSSGSHCKTDNVIDCCPKTKGTGKREALLACVHNFTGVCVAPHYPAVWSHTVRLLEAHCSGYRGPQVDAVWNGTVTHKKSDKCKRQRKKIIANQECGTHSLQELQMMWTYYNLIELPD